MDGNESGKKPKRSIIIISVILVILLAVGFFAGNYFYNFAINTKSDIFKSKDMPDVPGDENTGGFFDTHEVGDANISASLDGTPLYARSVVNGESDVWVIIAHCYGCDGSFMESYAERFYDMGYSTLLPDLRGHGQSGGSYRGMGWDDRLDMIDWINYINANYADAEIVLFGVSMGASTVMMTSGETLPENVRAVIEDCGYSSIYEEFKVQLKSMFGLPSFPILNLAGAVTKLRAGYNFMNEGDAASQMAKSVTPTLFIHGDADTFVPISMMEAVYNAASCEREKLIVPGADHAQSSTVAPELYWSTIGEFLNRHLEYQFRDAAA